MSNYKIIRVFFLVILCFGFLPVFVHSQTPLYRVRIYGGKWGSVNGKNYYEKSYPVGTYFRFQDLQTKSLHEKYYVKGIRETGKDNNTLSVSGFLVEKDCDYVLAFGIKEEQIAYEVRYVDENGKELSKTETYYGNVGDKPVVACQYISGYLPQARNITGILQKANNVFSFVYKPITDTSSSTVNPEKKTEQEEENQEDTDTTAPDPTDIITPDFSAYAPPSTNTDTSVSATSKPTTAIQTNKEEKGLEDIPQLHDLENKKTPLSSYHKKDNAKKKEKIQPKDKKKGICILFLPMFFFLLLLLLLLQKRKQDNRQTI